ncbi:MAG: FHA domain-containing protein [Pirellulaceae bacterium]|nr:FHA domain-containing protein [Pirellulaceae bacterium]
MSQSESKPPSESGVVVQLFDPTLDRSLKSWNFHEAMQINIGRGEDCDVEISDPYVSRRHARIERRGEEWVLVSLGRNGVLLDGDLITEKSLPAECTFRLGPSGPTIRFRDVAGPRGTPTGSGDILATICFDTTLMPIFELDKQKLNEDVGAIAEGDYFQTLQQKAKLLRQKRDA